MTRQDVALPLIQIRRYLFVAPSFYGSFASLCHRSGKPMSESRQHHVIYGVFRPNFHKKFQNCATSRTNGATGVTYK
jgi:hypothetical protein